jgi:hypothetical protein
VLGLAGIDKLLCFMVVHRLQRLLANYRSLAFAECAPVLAQFKAAMEPLNGLPEEAHALYTRALEQMPKAVWDSLLPTVTLLGQAQLLRRQIGVEASTSCKLDSNSLSCALEVRRRLGAWVECESGKELLTLGLSSGVVDVRVSGRA